MILFLVTDSDWSPLFFPADQPNAWQRTCKSFWSGTLYRWFRPDSSSSRLVYEQTYMCLYLLACTSTPALIPIHWHSQSTRPHSLLEWLWRAHPQRSKPCRCRPFVQRMHSKGLCQVGLRRVDIVSRSLVGSAVTRGSHMVFSLYIIRLSLKKELVVAWSWWIFAH